MKKQIESVLQQISVPDQAAMDAARARQASLAKPPHSLGLLEDLSIQISGITGKLFNRADRRRVCAGSARQHWPRHAGASCVLGCVFEYRGLSRAVMPPSGMVS